MNEKKYLDIVQTLSLKKNRNLFRGDLVGKLMRRKFIIKEFFRGKLKLADALFGVLPWRLISSKKFSNNFNISSLLANHFLGAGYYHHPIDFLEYKLHYLSSDSVNDQERDKAFCASADMVAQIVSHDQYCGREFIKNNSIIIDVGANIGIFTLFAAHLSRGGKIYAFEPATKTFNILNRTIVANNLTPNIHTINKALGDEDGRAILLVGADEVGGANLIDKSLCLSGKEDIFNISEEVSMTTLDKFIGENNIKKVDFIKIDAEGYEKQIIKGAREVIKKFSPVIACSAYHLKNDETEIPKLVLSINKNYNYRLENRGEKDLIFWPKK